MRTKGYIAVASIILGAIVVQAQPPLSVDPSFQTQIQWLYVADLEFLPDGKILTSGHMNFPGMIMQPYRGLARLNADGSLDNSFTGTLGAGAITTWGNYYIVGGEFAGIYRLFQDGSRDLSYWNPIPMYIYYGGLYHLLPDGSSLLTGLYNLRDTITFTPYLDRACLVKLDPNGQPDTTFTHRTCFQGYASGIQPTPDGKFMLSGSQSIYDGHAVGNILRIHPDGSLDTTFHSSMNWGRGHDFYFYPDGRILVAGFFTLPEYPNDTLEVMRLMPDGSVDMSWPILDFRQTGAYYAGIGAVSDLFEVEPGKLIVSGEFWDLNGEEVGGIAMIDTAGNVLQQYFTGGGCDSLAWGGLGTTYYRYIRAVERAPDGSLYIYGSYHGFDDGYSYHPDQRMITKLHPLNVGVEEQLAESSRLLAVWPNPAQDQLNVQLPQGLRGGVLRVLDATGRVVQEERFPASVSTFSFPIPALPSGLYTVQLIDPQKGRWLANWIKE